MPNPFSNFDEALQRKAGGDQDRLCQYRQVLLAAAEALCQDPPDESVRAKLGALRNLGFESDQLAELDDFLSSLDAAAKQGCLNILRDQTVDLRPTGTDG